MSECATYRRARGPMTGQGNPPTMPCVVCGPMELRDYWRDQDLLATTGAPNLRRVLSRALNRLAELERWTTTRAGRAA